LAHSWYHDLPARACSLKRFHVEREPHTASGFDQAVTSRSIGAWPVPRLVRSQVLDRDGPDRVLPSHLTFPLRRSAKVRQVRRMIRRHRHSSGAWMHVAALINLDIGLRSGVHTHP
ncbi:MAG: hypothetical protein ACR2PL_09215, partial [Dehalococcoidia bacterium]